MSQSEEFRSFTSGRADMPTSRSSHRKRRSFASLRPSALRAPCRTDPPDCVDCGGVDGKSTPSPGPTPPPETALAALRDVPVLTIFGERNDPFRFQAEWRRRFPAAEQVVVPNGNHFPMCDHPGLVAASIRRWMR